MNAPIVSSTTVKPRHLKVLLWGGSGTRKTESILRHFPNILLIDTEGNAEHCAEMPEIPEFLHARTKDLDEVIEVIDRVADGAIRFPDGRPVQTLALDSVTVLWTIRKDTRALIAEERSARYHRGPEDANFTQLDWTMAKRPLVRLNARLNNCPIKFVIFTAREQDAYSVDDRNRDKITKIGVKPETIKGLEYDMNLVLHMRHPAAETGRLGPWECEVTKVQGALGAKLPVGKVLKTFPAATILAYTGQLSGQPGADQDESEIETRHAARESAGTAAGPGAALEAASFWTRAAEIGYRAEDGSPDQAAIRRVLKARGHEVIVPSKVPELLRVLRTEWEAAHPSDIDQSAGAETEPQPQAHPARRGGWQPSTALGGPTRVVRNG
jgi:hypothetical protein